MSEVDSSEVDVAVVVVAWNSSKHLGACLDALTDALTGLSWQVVVVDNASTDSSVAIAREHLPAERGRLIESDVNLGFAGAVNLGFEAANAKYVFLLNPDCVMDEGSVRLLVEACESDPRVAGAAPVLRGADGSDQREFQFRRLPTIVALIRELLFIDRLLPNNAETRHYRNRDLDLSSIVSVEQPAAAALLLQSRAMRREGPFDEAFTPAWFEDVDYCKRLRVAGFTLLAVPDSTGVHFGGASLESLPDREFARIWYRNMAIYAAKWFSLKDQRRLRRTVIAGMLMRVVLTVVGFGRFRSSRRNVIRGWIDVMGDAWKR